jgi:putative hydrolase of the HAD superfamily
MIEVARDCIIFDGDNTLWHIEALYDEARRRLCEALGRLGVDPISAEAFQRRRDAELYGSHGYSPARFPQSFVDTLRHFHPAANQDLTATVRRLGEAVFEATPKVQEDADVVLAQLSTSHRLVLFTAGDEDIQRRRVAEFGRAHHFSCVRIVPTKNAHAFGTLLSDLQLDVRRTWMVGDSINSDILPALEAGLRAVYLKTANWHPVEQGESVVPLDVPTAHRLSDIPGLIANSPRLYN